MRHVEANEVIKSFTRRNSSHYWSEQIYQKEQNHHLHKVGVAGLEVSLSRVRMDDEQELEVIGLRALVCINFGCEEVGLMNREGRGIRHNEYCIATKACEQIPKGNRERMSPLAAIIINSNNDMMSLF